MFFSSSVDIITDFLLVNEYGLREVGSYGIMTFGFIYLPAVPAMGAFLGHSIAGILGILWSIIMMLFGLCLAIMLGESILSPNQVSFYLMIFGFMLLWMGLYQGKFRFYWGRCSL